MWLSTREKVRRVELLLAWHWSWRNKIARIQLFLSKQGHMGGMNFILFMASHSVFTALSLVKFLFMNEITWIVLFFS